MPDQKFTKANQENIKAEVDKARKTTSLRLPAQELRRCKVTAVNTTYNICSGTLIKADGSEGDPVKNIRFSGTAPTAGDFVFLKQHRYSRIFYVVSGTGGGGVTPYVISSLGFCA